MLDSWQVAVLVVLSGTLGAATGLLKSDARDDTFIDFWTPELRRKHRWMLAGIHLVVGAIGAAAAIGLGWIPTTKNPWWVANAFAYAASSVAVFRADVSGFKLGTATTGRSILKLVEDRARAGIARSIDQNVGTLVQSATDKKLVVAAFLVMEENYQGNVGYRELVDDITKAEKVLDPAVSLPNSPSEAQTRVWLQQFVVDGVRDKQLVIRGHKRWTDASADWSID